MKSLLILFLLFLSLVPLSAISATEDEPLTLLKQPQKNAALQQTQPAGETSVLRDIHGPIELKNQSRTLIYGALILLLLLILWGIYLLIKKRKKAAPPLIPPWDQALLEISEARILLSSNMALGYMGRISLILRRYVESRFAIKSTRQTTREFLHNLNNSSTDPVIRSCRGELQTCLEQCDMTKFAHHIPQQENMEMMEGAVIAFVEKTRPDIQPKGAAS